MKFGSVCSGIEAASVAWSSLGWRPQWFSEINPFCCSVLKRHYPETTNLGDATTAAFPRGAELIIGGTPCQGFSVNGRRQGMDDPRSRLAHQFVRAIDEGRPRWFIWENVPGVHSSGGGEDLYAFADSLVELGFGVFGRVLDAHDFGTPMRRRRFYLVGYFGSWQPAFAVLSDGPQHRPRSDAVREARRQVAGIGASDDGQIAYGWLGDETPKWSPNASHTLRAGQGGEGVFVSAPGRRPRRIVPREWERLMGFPPDYSNVTHNGKPASDSNRTHALGNSFCVPVIRWLGERIDFVHGILEGRK